MLENVKIGNSTSGNLVWNFKLNELFVAGKFTDVLTGTLGTGQFRTIIAVV